MQKFDSKSSLATRNLRITLKNIEKTISQTAIKKEINDGITSFYDVNGKLVAYSTQNGNYRYPYTTYQGNVGYIELDPNGTITEFNIKNQYIYKEKDGSLIIQRTRGSGDHEIKYYEIIDNFKQLISGG